MAAGGIEVAKAFITIRAELQQLRKDMDSMKHIVTKDVSGIASSIKSAMGSALSMIGAGSVSMAFMSMSRAGEQFNRQMNASMAIMDDLSDKMKNDLRDAAFETARVTVFSASQSAQAYYSLISAGLSTEQAILALPKAAQFAQASLMDLGQAIDQLSGAQAAMGLKVNDPVKNMENLVYVSDMLTGINKLALGTAKDFAVALSTKSAAAARMAGIELKDLVAVMGAFAEQGIHGEDAGNAINVVFRDLQTKTIKHRDAWNSLGVAVYDSTGAMRNMADILVDLEKALGTLSPEEKKQQLLLLGLQDRSLAFLQMLIGMSGRVKYFANELEKMGGITAKVASKQMTPFQKGWALVSAEMVKLASNMMALLYPSIISLSRAMFLIIGPINAVLSGFLSLDKMMGGWASKIVVAGLAIMGLIKIMGLVTIAAKTMSKSLGIAQALAGPKGWATLLISLGVAAGATYAVDQAFGSLTDESYNVSEAISDIKAEMDKATGSVGRMTEGTKELADTLKGVPKIQLGPSFPPEKEKPLFDLPRYEAASYLEQEHGKKPYGLMATEAGKEKYRQPTGGPIYSEEEAKKAEVVKKSLEPYIREAERFAEDYAGLTVEEKKIIELREQVYEQMRGNEQKVQAMEDLKQKQVDDVGKMVEELDKKTKEAYDGATDFSGNLSEESKEAFAAFKEALSGMGYTLDDYLAFPKELQDKIREPFDELVSALGFQTHAEETFRARIELQKELDEFVKEVNNFGQPTKKLSEKLEEAGAAPVDIGRAKEAESKKAEQEAIKREEGARDKYDEEMENAGKDIRKSLQTPAETFMEQYQRIGEVLRSRQISEDEARKAVIQAGMEYRKMPEQITGQVGYADLRSSIQEAITAKYAENLEQKMVDQLEKSNLKLDELIRLFEQNENPLGALA